MRVSYLGSLCLPLVAGHADPDFYTKLKSNCYASAFTDNTKWTKVSSGGGSHMPLTLPVG